MMTVISKALVENGVVSNVAVFDTDNLPSWADSWVDVDGTVSIGFLHDGTSFTDPTPPLTDEQLSSAARSRRDQFLLSSDWTQIADVPVDKPSWSTYRQQLRDITIHANWPNLQDNDWPTKPS